MGITVNCAKFLLYSKRLGVDFEKTLMLGRQRFFCHPEEVKKLKDKFQLDINLLPANQAYAEPFFELMGAKSIDSMDYSSFEQATIIHDLNQPVKEPLTNKYSTVFDGGTLEHVFNFSMAIKNCMNMIKVGGHFVAITPTNNHCGHGFYQFSPELFFSLFNETHGFSLKLLAIGVEVPQSGIAEWFEVKNPQIVKKRVTLSNCYPTSLMVVAQKIKDTENIELRPFQSDYEHIWSVHDSIKQDVQIEGESKWLHLYRKWVPEFVKSNIRKVRDQSEEQVNIEGLGSVNPTFFSRIDI